MLRYALTRAVVALATLAGVSTLVFLLMAAAPGDPARLAGRAGSRAYAVSPEAVAAFRVTYRLDAPLPVRLGKSGARFSTDATFRSGSGRLFPPPSR